MRVRRRRRCGRLAARPSAATGRPVSRGAEATLMPMPIAAARPAFLGNAALSIKIPAILAPPSKTSFGHLRRSRPSCSAADGSRWHRVRRARRRTRAGWRCWRLRQAAARGSRRDCPSASASAGRCGRALGFAHPRRSRAVPWRPSQAAAAPRCWLSRGFRNAGLWRRRMLAGARLRRASARPRRRQP